MDLETIIDSSEFSMTWTISNFDKYTNKDTILRSEEITIPIKNYNISCRLLFQPLKWSFGSKYYTIAIVIVTNKTLYLDCEVVLQDCDKKQLLLLENSNNVPVDKYNGSNFIMKKRYCRQHQCILPLKNGILIIKSKIKVKLCKEYKINELKSSESNKLLLENFNNLLVSGRLSDVVLETSDGIQISAHKCILGAQSPVFAAMFEHDMKESQENKVSIADIDSDVLRAMLEFMYSHKFNKSQTKMDQLFIASNKYQILNLKMLCEIELCEQLTVENAVDFLILSDCHQSQKLKSTTLAFIKTNIKDIIKIDTLKNLKMINFDLSYDIIKLLAE